MGCTSAHDNAVAESFFASLTKDLLRRRALRSRAKARTAIFDYIETFYNPIRLHSTLDYLSPADYERIRGRATSRLTNRCPPKRGRSTSTITCTYSQPATPPRRPSWRVCFCEARLPVTRCPAPRMRPAA